MRYEHFAIETEGQKEGKASLHAYLLDAISVAPEKKRPAVIVCAGGGYERKSDRESEPVVLQFLREFAGIIHLTYYEKEDE